MAKHLVSCVCGRQLAVDTGQAGESLACDCGAQVAVPTLRQLRLLPAVSEASASAIASTWGVRQGTITVLLLLAGGCLLAAAGSRLSERPVPTIDPTAYQQEVDRRVGQLTPLEGWQRWIDTYQPLANTGFNVYKHPAIDAMQGVLNWHYWIQRIALALAAMLGVAALALVFAGGNRAKD